jgi:hypothetical protein
MTAARLRRVRVEEDAGIAAIARSQFVQEACVTPAAFIGPRSPISGGLLFFCREDIVRFVPWDRPFAEPIELPNGKRLITLRDAALYVTKLPKAEHDAKEWQAAMLALLLVAEHDGPTMFARIGLMRALNRHVERVFDPSRKDHHWGRRKLARDR